MKLFGLLRNRPPPLAERPLRDELLSIERLEERARALAARFTLDPNPRSTSRNVLPRFEDNARVLRRAYLTMADDVHRGEFVTPAAEWLLDNFHLVASEILDVRRSLPPGYYRELPKLALRELAGDARVYAMAIELIRHSDSRLDRQQLVRFMNSYQAVAPLTIGELWAWPSMLKLALIENLRRLAEETLQAREAVRAADAYVARIDAAGHGRPPPLPERLHPGYVVQLLQRLREYGPRLAAVSRCRRFAPRGPADDLGGRDPERASAPGGDPGLGGERRHEPPSLRRARLEPVLRGGQPDRARAAARSGRGLREHGLPEPRPLPPGGGGAVRAHRRSAAARGPARRRERSAGRGERAGRRTAPPTSATTSSARAAPTSRPTSPIVPASVGGYGASPSRMRPPSISARSGS